MGKDTKHKVYFEPVDIEIEPVSFEDSFEQVKSRFEGILSNLGLRVPEGVTQ